MTDAKARAIGVLVDALEIIENVNEPVAWGMDSRFVHLDAIAELLSPSPAPANFYDYRV